MGSKFEKFPVEKASGKQVPFSGHSSGEISEKDLSKELKENSYAKMEFIDMLKDITQRMNSGDSYEIIDTIVERDGASVELADSIEEFIKKIGSQNIVANSSSVDFIRNVSSDMLALVSRIVRKAQEGKLPSKKFEEYSANIRDDYEALRKYFNLMEKHSDFRAAEIGSIDGYVARINPDLAHIKLNRNEYVDWSERNLADKSN